MNMASPYFKTFITSILLATTLLLCSGHASQSPLVGSDPHLSCPDHKYTTHIFSHDPLVIYISDFISEVEANHLEEITKDKFARSYVADSSGHELNATTRTSQSASLSARDNIIRCIENRALAFQGLSPSISSQARQRLEPLQLVKYDPGQQYHAHTDWFTSPSHAGPEVGGNRFSSFFVYVSVSQDLRGGGTRFEVLDAKGYPGAEKAALGLNGGEGGEGDGEEWCNWTNCDEEWEAGVTFRPVARNAVFWVNMMGNGRGDERTLHAGLPVTRGWKLGMNIWTREGVMDTMYRGDD